MGKSTPAAPPPPDYRGAAIAQGAANVDAARVQSKLSNPNTYTPYGTQLISYDGDQPTITQTLTPQAQKTLDESQKTQYQLAALAGKGAGLASNVLDKSFQFSGPAVQTSFNQGGPLQNAPSAGQYGLAGAVNSKDYGQAKGGVNNPNLTSSLNLNDVAKMPVNAGMTGQQAIMSRLEPSLQKNRVSTETQLINQGLRPGTEAYNNAAQLLGQQENDARQQAALQGINLDLSANQQGYGQALQNAEFGNQAQLSGFNANLQNQQAANQAINQNFNQGLSAQQMQNQAINQNYGQGMSSAQSQNAIEAQKYNQSLQGAQFGNTAQQQALAQAIQQRQMPLNEINALQSGSQIQNPQFGAYAGTNVAAAPVFGAAQAQGQADQNTFNQQVATQNANTAGLYSLAGSGVKALAMSDVRLKSNIVKVGNHPIGIGIYEYDIFGQRERGVIAQELMQVMPDAVHQHPSGYLMVDYGRL